MEGYKQWKMPVGTAYFSAIDGVFFLTIIFAHKNLVLEESFRCFDTIYHQVWACFNSRKPENITHLLVTFSLGML